MRKTTFSLALLASLFTAVAGFAQKSEDTPVTTTIQGLGVNTSPTLRIQTDQLGPYKNSRSLDRLSLACMDGHLPISRI